jgi:hypothetical protein
MVAMWLATHSNDTMVSAEAIVTPQVAASLVAVGTHWQAGFVLRLQVFDKDKTQQRVGA